MPSRRAILAALFLIVESEGEFGGCAGVDDLPRRGKPIADGGQKSLG